MSVIIPAAIVLPPARNINLPNSLLSAYVSIQTGDSVLISTCRKTNFLLVKTKTIFVKKLGVSTSGIVLSI